jgi:hypothetical protein
MKNFFKLNCYGIVSFGIQYLDKYVKMFRKMADILLQEGRWENTFFLYHLILTREESDLVEQIDVYL